MLETRAIYRQADAAYRPHSCPATAECCQLAVTKRQPWLWPSEWQVLRARLAADGRGIPPAREDGACPLLDASGKRCTVYEDRPFGCRTFFCARRTGPAREPVARVNALLERLSALNLELDEAAAPVELLALLERAR